MTVRLTARCVRGLEWMLAAEVERVAPGRDAVEDDTADEIQLSERQVSFDVRRLRPELLSLRTADDLMLNVETLRGIGHTRAALTDLSRRLARIDFAAALARLGEVRALPPRPTTLAFDVVASLLGRRNYNRFAVEDTAGQVVADVLGARYVSRNPDAGDGTAAGTGSTDFTVRLSLSGDTVEVYLRLPGKPLHRRPWKLDTGPGTLHPPLAAALVQIGGAARADAPGSRAVGSDTAGSDTGALDAAFDPFCGDGTIAIEAALAFPDAWIFAADLDAERLRNARANAERAGAPGVQFEHADAGRATWGADRFDLLVTNPPWNRSVGAAGALTDTLDPFWQRVPGALTADGRVCTIAEAELDVPTRLRRLGYSVALAQTIRLAGRVSHVVLAAPPDAAEPRLPERLELWHERAIKAGIIAPDGF